MTEPLRPPPTDTAWLEVQEQRGRPAGWVRPAGTPRHTCTPPGVGFERGWPEAEGQAGDLWRCGCGRLWRVAQTSIDARPRREWRPASRWQRIRYWRRP